MQNRRNLLCFIRDVVTTVLTFWWCLTSCTKHNNLYVVTAFSSSQTHQQQYRHKIFTPCTTTNTAMTTSWCQSMSQLSAQSNSHSPIKYDHDNDDDNNNIEKTNNSKKKNGHDIVRHVMASLAISTILVFTAGGINNAVYADEYGVEKEAPTIFTGETVQICTKRGPLGACLQTEIRTAENDNDRSNKYFRQPTDVLQRNKDSTNDNDPDKDNVLVEKLRKQTEENREKNALIVKQKTLLNDQVRCGFHLFFVRWLFIVLFLFLRLNFRKQNHYIVTCEKTNTSSAFTGPYHLCIHKPVG